METAREGFSMETRQANLIGWSATTRPTYSAQGFPGQMTQIPARRFLKLH